MDRPCVIAGQPPMCRVYFWPGATQEGEGEAGGGRWGWGRRMPQPEAAGGGTGERNPGREVGVEWAVRGASRPDLGGDPECLECTARGG